MTDTEHPPATTRHDQEPTRLQSLALGDTAVEQGAPRNVTNWPALVALVAFFAFIGSLGLIYLLMVLGFVVMIFLHELGHFMTAKWTGMKATQFFIGFGPTIISRTRGEVEYGIKALPLGAFVRIIGMSNLDPVDPAEEHLTYRSKSYPRRMLVITAGSIMHFIQAVILFVIAFSVIGLPNPDSPDWSVGELSRLETGETPSVEAGIELGDRIVAIDGVEFASWGDLVTEIQGRPGDDVVLTILRDGERLESSTTLAAVPTDTGEEIGFLGVYRAFPRERQGVVAGLEATLDMGVEAITFIPSQLFSPSVWADLGSLVFDGSAEVDVSSEEAQRPISLVGAVRISGDVAEVDWVLPITFLASINVFVGVLNLIPLLPLDGGHAAIATYERLRSRRGQTPYRADITKLLPITYAVVFLFGFIGLTTIWLDIVRPIS